MNRLTSIARTAILGGSVLPTAFAIVPARQSSAAAFAGRTQPTCGRPHELTIAHGFV